MEIGTTGVWTRMDGFSIAEAVEFAQRVEELGYGALWIPDAFGRDPFTHAALLFQHTKKLVIATGVVNIHLREAQATACAQRELWDQSGGRFLLGLGVSHQTAVEPLFGKVYPAPLPSMREYLDRLDNAMWWGPELTGAPPVILAALGPLMLRFAAERVARCPPILRPAGEHASLTRDHGGRSVAVSRAEGPAGVRPREGPGACEAGDGGAAHHAELPQDSDALRLPGSGAG